MNEEINFWTKKYFDKGREIVLNPADPVIYAADLNAMRSGEMLTLCDREGRPHSRIWMDSFGHIVEDLLGVPRWGHERANDTVCD